MKGSKEKLQIIIAGLLIGVVAAVLVLLGNPANMGFCIACFIRDTAGALVLHRAAAVQYLRPEIIGIILGSFLLACPPRPARVCRGDRMRRHLPETGIFAEADL